MLHFILVWYSNFQLVVSIPTVLGEDIRELLFLIPYFPAHKTHFFPRKMLPKFDLRLMRRG